MDKIGFVFPGQGSQSVGMGKDLYDRYDCAKKIYDMAGQRIKKLSFEGPSEELTLTDNAQPCLFAMDMACAAVLKEHGVECQGVAGFSLGEIPAVCHSGIMEIEQAYDFVRFRGKVMRECADAHGGEMYAIIKLSSDEIEEICAGLENAYPVNYNCDGQTVVACSQVVSPKLMDEVVRCGGKAIKLAVNGAFHSPYMNEASEKIGEYLREKKPGKMKIPVYSNVTAETYVDPWNLLSRQASSPVLWKKTIENMINDGFNMFIEAGPGKVLSGLIKKIDGSVRVLNIIDILTEVENA